MKNWKNLTTTQRVLLIAVPTVVVAWTLIAAGQAFGTLDLVVSVFFIVLAYQGLLVATYFLINQNTPNKIVNEVDRRMEQARNKAWEQRQALAQEYKLLADPIKNEFRKKYNSQKNKESLYQRKLEALWPPFQEREKVITDALQAEQLEAIAWGESQHHVKKVVPEKLWRALLVLPLIVFAVLIFYAYGAKDYGIEHNGPTGGGWTAKDLVPVHLEHKNQYVNNPDHVLTDDAVKTVNGILSRMDSKLGIETACIVVNHIANDDPFRLAQDIFDRYHVGRIDRGMVIVMGYEDRAIRIHTGYALEEYLTDAACNSLMQKYMRPYLLDGNPSMGMVTLTEALYRYLAGQSMPVVSKAADSDSPIDIWNLELLLFAMIIIWGAASYAMWGLYGNLLKDKHPTKILDGPWHEDTVRQRIVERLSRRVSGSSGSSDSDEGYSWSSSSDSDSSSSYSSSSSDDRGSYGGGGSGGGGSTMRW